MRLQKLRRPSKEAFESLKKFGRDFKGKIAAIEPESGEYFLGKTALEAFHKARKKYPKAMFYFIRIGYPAVDFHKGGFKKL